MSTVCINNEWYNIGDIPPVPDCGSENECPDDEYIVPEPNERILKNEFGRSIDSVLMSIDYVADNNTAKSIYNSGQLSGNATITNDFSNTNRNSDVTITIVGNAGSYVKSVKSEIKLRFDNKSGNVILDGFFSDISGKIQNDLRLMFGTQIKLSGDLTVDRIVNTGGRIDYNGFRIIVLNNRFQDQGNDSE